MPETRLAAAVSCGRVRAWHARKFARSSRPRKEFGRVDFPQHDRKIIGTLPGIPRGGFFYWSFAFGAASAWRQHLAGSAEAPSPRPVQARLQRSSFCNFTGGGHWGAGDPCKIAFRPSSILGPSTNYGAPIRGHRLVARHESASLGTRFRLPLAAPIRQIPGASALVR